MDINDIGGGVFSCRGDHEIYGEYDFCIGMVAGEILMYGKPASQKFEYMGQLNKEELKVHFKDRNAIVRAARIHTRGLLDRQGFVDDLKKLHSAGELLDEQIKALEIFIHSCNCAPVKAIQKLIERGHAELVSRVRIYKESPLLTQTVDLFHEFINTMK